MKYSSRFFLYAPLGVFLLLFGLAGVHWWIKASALSDRLDAMNGREIAPGATFAFQTRRITGFPFGLDTQLHNVAFTIQAPHGPTRWTAEKFAMHALTYGRSETVFEAAGHQMLQWTRPDGTRGTLAFAVGSLHASAIVQDGALSRFDFDLVGLGSKAFTARRLQFHGRRNGQNRLQLLVSVEGLPAGTCALHPKGIDKGELQLTLSRADAFAPLLTGNRAWPLAVVDWRKMGGKTRAGGLWITPSHDANKHLALQAALMNLPAEELPGIAAFGAAFCSGASQK